MFALLSGREKKKNCKEIVSAFSSWANPNLLLMLGEIWRESCSLGRKDTNVRVALWG